MRGFGNRWTLCGRRTCSRACGQTAALPGKSGMIDSVSFVRPSYEFWRGRRVLVTGHTGFKGSWLSVWLRRLALKFSGLHSHQRQSRTCSRRLGLARWLRVALLTFAIARRSSRACSRRTPRSSSILPRNHWSLRATAVQSRRLPPTFLARCTCLKPSGR